MEEQLFGTDAATHPDDAVYVRVALERGLDRGAADATLTYRAHDDTIAVGQAVEAPLGRGNTPTRGIVIDRGSNDLLDGYDAAKVKPLARTLGTPLTPELVDLARWLSRYYVCPLGMTLASMIPAAVKQDIGRRPQVLIAPSQDPAEPVDAKLSPTARDAWAAIAKLPADTFPTTARDLADVLGQRSVAAINRLIKAGLLAEHTTTTVRARSDESDAIFETAAAPEPTPEQAAAIDRVTQTLGTYQRHLLFGVTGSGKTEVYLRLLDAVLQRGQTAVMLVPEIALTPQTAGRVQSRLGAGRVAVLHSGLTAAQRNRAWSRVASGDCPVVVGARSAVFAPVDNLGLVIVDEEHDGSYKQDQLPRYHARDVAIKRAHQNGCPVLLGSATPSLESWHAARAGRSTLLELPRRVSGAAMPTVRVVDMVAERKVHAEQTGKAPRELVVGPTLAKAVRSTLAEGGQIVFLLNRRGFAGMVSCVKTSCGWQQMCDHCDAKLVLHKDSQLRRSGYVRCHHCQAEELEFLAAVGALVGQELLGLAVV
ncbi:MAG: primosomal protein N', partial [Planctomycetota bacterium]